MGSAGINGSASLGQTLAADAQSLSALKYAAASSSPQAIKETAKQFESLFMRELVKSMRDANASMKSGMLDNEGTNLGSDLLDQQFAVQMSGKPGGLSDLIAAQLTRQAQASAAAVQSSTADKAATTAAAPTASTNHASTSHPLSTVARHGPTATQTAFVDKLSDVANRVAGATGIPAHYMLGQAGHETGWGQHEIKLKGGAPSYNLFGIKAGADWKGKVAEVTTTEYVNGVAQKRVARFRAYGSYEESFRDYANMITTSPRYAQAKLQTSSPMAFASGLQKAGYATDPDYASKLSRAINTTLSMRRVQV